MNTIMDIDTDGAIRVACGRQDYKVISRLAMSAVDGLCSMEFRDCFGRADYPAVREYAEKLLESGELKYELAEHCVAEGIKHSTEGPHYIFSYSVLCKGFDGEDAWHAGISPAIYTKASCLLSDGDLPPDGGFDAPDRCRLLPLHSVGARPSRRGGAEVSFDVPVSAFARVLSGERYMELLHAVHRYNMQPQLHCLCLLFNTDGIKKLCRMCVENIMKGHAREEAKMGEDKPAYGAVLGQPQESAGQGHPVDAALKKRGVRAHAARGVAGCPDACMPTAEKREAMWKDCRRDLESAGISSKTRPEGLYKVTPGECLDLFIADSVQGYISPRVDDVLSFFAERGDKRVVKARGTETVYVFVKGHHVAARRFRKDARESVVPAEPLPTREYTVGYDERTSSGKDGREMQRSRGVVWVDLRANDTGTMAGQYGRTELKPGTYRVYGSDDMYSMVEGAHCCRDLEGAAEVSDEVQTCITPAVVPDKSSEEAVAPLDVADPGSENRESMWKDCLRELGAVRIDSTPVVEGLYEVAPDTSLDLFIAEDVCGCECTRNNNARCFSAKRGDRRTVTPGLVTPLHVFVKGRHVAVERKCDDNGIRVVSTAKPLPCVEYTVPNGFEHGLWLHRGAVVEAPSSQQGEGSLLRCEAFCIELKAGTYMVYEGVPATLKAGTYRLHGDVGLCDITPIDKKTSRSCPDAAEGDEEYSGPGA